MRLFFKSMQGVMLLLFLSQYVAAGNYYRTKASGNWADPNIWEVSAKADFSAVMAAAGGPDFTSDSIVVLHLIELSRALTIDQTHIAISGKLILADIAATSLTINDGTGVDLFVNGVLEDHQTTSARWLANATWMMGHTGTLIKSKSTSAVNWQNKHSGEIPATSTWVYQKKFADNPSVATAGAVYGNLVFENLTTTLWDAMQVGSRLAGTASTSRIRGSLTVTHNCKIYLDNSADHLYKVDGNLEIQSGAELHFASNVPVGFAGASGIELQGDLIVNGKLTYNPLLATKFNRVMCFSGSKIQLFKGNGSVDLCNVIINKQGGCLQLEKDMVVDHQLSLSQGYILLNGHSLKMIDPLSSALAPGNGYLQAEDQRFASSFSRHVSENVNYTFPFGFQGRLFPVIVKGTGYGGYVALSTYGTETDNLSIAGWFHGVFQLPFGEMADEDNHYVDRYWKTDYQASAVAEISFEVKSTEVPSFLTDWKAYHYNGALNGWKETILKSIFSNSNKATVTAEPSAMYWCIKGSVVSLALEPNETMKKTINLIPGKCWIYNQRLYWTVEGDVRQLLIYDQEGRLMKELAGSGENSLDIEELPAGVYFVSLNLGSSTEVYKITKLE